MTFYILRFYILRFYILRFHNLQFHAKGMPNGTFIPFGVPVNIKPAMKWHWVKSAIRWRPVE